MDTINKAACALFVHDTGGPEERWHTRADQPEYVARVRAVLEAMRDPGNDILQAGFNAEATANPYKTQPHHVVPAVWNAMINAALAPPPQS